MRQLLVWASRRWCGARHTGAAALRRADAAVGAGRAVVPLLACVLGWGSAAAQPALQGWPADGPPCLGDKAATDAAGAGPSTAPDNAGLPARTRLPGLRYACLRLADGRAVLAGQAGPEDADTPAVLLVHGLGQNGHHDWAPTIAALAPRYRVVVLDLPGFGASPPPGQAYTFDALDRTLAGVLDQALPGRRVHLVGHSMGAAAALHFAHRHPARVHSLVLVDAAGMLLKPVFVHELSRQVAPRVGFAPVDRLLGWLEGGVNGLRSAVLLGRGDRYDFLPWLMRHAEVRQALLGGLVQVDAALGLVEHDFSAALREVQAPTTVIWGEHDRVAPLRTGQVLARRLPQAQLQVVAGAGHTPMLEQPAAFHRVLLAALDAQASAPSAAASPVPQPKASSTGLAWAPPAGPSQGHVRCEGASGQRYSGRFDSLSLQDCGGVRVEDAWIGRLVLRNSTVNLVNSVVQAPADRVTEAAVDAVDSELTATASLFQGPLALRSENSFFDLAGVSLRAQGPVLDLRGAHNRLFLSVSDWRGSDLQGDAHGIWPRP